MQSIARQTNDPMVYDDLVDAQSRSLHVQKDKRRNAMVQDRHFDPSQQLRGFTERNVAQARAAYGQCIDAMMQATDMWLGAVPSNEMTSGMKLILEKAVLFANQNVEACFAFASELANARDLQDVVGIQSRYAQAQMQAYALQAQELGRLMTAAAQGMKIGR
jgi:hypothetical protein